MSHGRARTDENDGGGDDAEGEKKPDGYARAFVSHPQPELLEIHDRKSLAVLRAIREMGGPRRAWRKAHGNYEHWLWPLFPKENSEAGCQNCHASDMVLASRDAQLKTINNGERFI